MAKYADKKLSNGKKVRVKLLPAVSVGIPVARRLMDIIAPVVGGSLDGMKHDDFIHGAPRTFTEMAMTVCKQLEKAEVGSLVFTLLEGLEVDNTDVDLDEYFTANYGEMVEILEFALKENFQSFFTGDAIKQRFLKMVQMVASNPIESES